jgi:hypothetical protein
MRFCTGGGSGIAIARRSPLDGVVWNGPTPVSTEERETVDVIERRACPNAELYKRKIGKIYPFRLSR